MSEDCIILDTPELKRETNSIHKQPELNDYFENYTACGSVLKVEFRRHNEEEIVVFTLQKSNIDHQYFTIKIYGETGMKKALLNKSLIYNNKPSLLYDYLHKSILASETTSKLTIEECTNNQYVEFAILFSDIVGGKYVHIKINLYPQPFSEDYKDYRTICRLSYYVYYKGAYYENLLICISQIQYYINTLYDKCKGKTQLILQRYSLLKTIYHHKQKRYQQDDIIADLHCQIEDTEVLINYISKRRETTKSNQKKNKKLEYKKKRRVHDQDQFQRKRLFIKSYPKPLNRYSGGSSTRSSSEKRNRKEKKLPHKEVSLIIKNPYFRADKPKGHKCETTTTNPSSYGYKVNLCFYDSLYKDKYLFTYESGKQILTLNRDKESFYQLCHNKPVLMTKSYAVFTLLYLRMNDFTVGITRNNNLNKANSSGEQHCYSYTGCTGAFYHDYYEIETIRKPKQGDQIVVSVNPSTLPRIIKWYLNDYLIGEFEIYDKDRLEDYHYYIEMSTKDNKVELS